jgi:hypothetical protein
MKGLEILQKYPHSADVVRKWLFDKMMESMQDDSVPEDFKQSMMNEAVTNVRLAVFIDTNPRILFDVFDENDIIIYFMIFSSPEGVRFSAAIHTGNDEVKPNPIGKQYNTRKEAEHAAVEAAFEILENKLTPAPEQIEVKGEEIIKE